MKDRRGSDDDRGLHAASDVSAFESHLQQLYLYYKARRRRGQAVVVISSAWACYNVSVWVKGWMATGEFSWFLLFNTAVSVALAGACLHSTYRDSQVYVPHRYESRSNGILGLLGLTFEGRSRAGDALKRKPVSTNVKAGESGAGMSGRAGGR